jgi:capsid protein
MSTTPAQATTSPGRELAARARHVAGLLGHLADAAESSQPGAVGSWMRRVRQIHASVRDELMTAAVALERAAGASWTTIGAAQDPPVSRQAAHQRYQRLLRRANLTSDGDTVAKPAPQPARHAETSTRPSTTVLTHPPGVARNTSVSHHARPSPLAACGPPTIGAT